MTTSHQLFEVVPETAKYDLVDSSSSSDEETSSNDGGVSESTAGSTSVAEERTTRQKRDYRPPSTFHLKPRSEQTFWERVVMRIGMMDDSYYRLLPETTDLGPVPTHPQLGEHIFILKLALIVPALQHLSYLLFPSFKWPVALAYPLYVVNYAYFLVCCLKRFRFYATKYGTFNQRERGRDRIPDAAIPQVAKGFLAYLLVRTFGEFSLKWDRNAMPLESFSLTTPIRMFAWLVVMDYFFYVYHRTSHEVDFFWSVHQTHHTTRTPNPVLSILAGELQEVIEIALVPLAATLIVPMNFHELFLMACYTGYVEVLGHSGIRAKWQLPIAGPPLSLIDCDLHVEDHDLHHRYGKSGRNYGKQTRLWDKIFGTTDERIEIFGM